MKKNKSNSLTEKIKKRKNNRIYFTKGTEAAIVQYNTTEDQAIRNRIYVEHIQKPLDKLAENIINRFKFPYMQGSFQEVKDQVVSFLVLNLHKYSENKGKAFSYFSVIAKNYLILNNNNSYKQEKKTWYFSDAPEGQSHVLDGALMVDTEMEETKKDMSEFSRLMIAFWDHNLTRVFRKKRDIDIANAVIELFRRADGIENFNKKALYLMIREMTGQKTNAITKVVSKMSSYVEQHLKDFKQSGVIAEGSEYFVYR